jgi:hypothetical protein
MTIVHQMVVFEECGLHRSLTTDWTLPSLCCIVHYASDMRDASDGRCRAIIGSVHVQSNIGAIHPIDSLAYPLEATMACQDYLPDSLHPGKVILLAGAGASAYLGVPALDQLLKRAILGIDDISIDEEVVERIRRTSQMVVAAPPGLRNKAVFEEVIVKLKEYWAISETLRTDSLFQHEFGQMPSEVGSGHLAGKWKAALTQCYRVLLHYYGPAKIAERNQSAEFQTILRLLRTLTEHNGGRLHIYTTNYDCSYQVLASNCQNICFMSHIHNKTGRFSEGWYNLRPDLEDFELPKVYVHRLHGCVGWFTSNGGLAEEIYGSGSDLEIVDDDKLPSMCLKLVTSQLVGTNPVFASAFEEFCSHLKDIDILLVWGYSFRDLEVLRAINQAFSQRAPFPVLYIDPFMKETVAMQRVRDTLHTAPIPIDPRFVPKNIDWKPVDGYERLIDAVIDSLEKEGV